MSNLGVNNFNEPQQIFRECLRVLKPGGKLVLTTNVNGHWKEFYQVFRATANELNKPDLADKLTKQELHRGDENAISALFSNAGFTHLKSEEDSFNMRFLNGTAFLNHHFVKVGWLSSWQELIPKEEWDKVFPALERNLNAYASGIGELCLSLPMLYVEGEK